MDTKHKDDHFSDKETARRRDEVIRRMANTPPQPHAKATTRPAGKKKTTAEGQAARKSGVARKVP